MWSLCGRWFPPELGGLTHAWFLFSTVAESQLLFQSPILGGWQVFLRSRNFLNPLCVLKFLYYVLGESDFSHLTLPRPFFGIPCRTRLSDFSFTFHFHELEKEMATHSSVLAWRNPRDGGAWWAAVCGVAQSRTRLKRLSSSSSSGGPRCTCLMSPLAVVSGQQEMAHLDPNHLAMVLASSCPAAMGVGWLEGEFHGPGRVSR